MGTPIPMLDLMFFLTETRDNPRHVGALLVFERPKSRRTDFVGRVVAAFRRAVPVAPFNRVPLFRKAGLPEWQEAETLDMDWHVQSLALPAPAWCKIGGVGRVEFYDAINGQPAKNKRRS